jgi:hypothetical protein
MRPHNGREQSRQTNLSGAKNYNRHRCRGGEERKHDWCRCSMNRKWSSPVLEAERLAEEEASRTAEEEDDAEAHARLSAPKGQVIVLPGGSSPRPRFLA